MKDSFKHQGLRKQLVKIILEKGIKNKNVLKAIETVPRHLFMDSGFIDFAYQDKPFPIGASQTISQPYTVAFQTELLDIKRGDKVLEIGTGSGYQAAILIEMGAKIYTIERQKELYNKTKPLLEKICYKPKKIIFGDGYKGLPDEAPFDSIIVTAGAPFVPKALLSQLKIDGRLVIPVGKNVQIMNLIIRTGENSFEKQECGEFRFVPMLKRKN